MSREPTLPTIRELLARRGFFIKPDALAGILVIGCERGTSKCTHGSGPIPASDVIEMALSRTHPTEDCRLLQTHLRRSYPELTAFHILCVSILHCSEDPDFLLDEYLERMDDWSDKWGDLLLTHESRLSFKELNEAWVRSSIRTHKDLLQGLFLDWIEQADNWNYAEIPAEPSGNDPLVLIHPLHHAAHIKGYLLCEELYGPSGIPGVIKVPARYVRVVPFKKARLRAKVWDVSRYEEALLPRGVVWYLGDRPCWEPVPLLDSYTPSVLETAGTLMENMTLKEALAAALAL